jgi:D-alanyl-D-alanine carboxypeptidase/D-alanyl-D-alanine-endopeptidase (penicillin-binding protein 4)
VAAAIGPGSGAIVEATMPAMNATAVGAATLALVSALALQPAPALAQHRLPPDVQSALARAGVPADALAAVALPLRHRDRAWRWRAEVPMAPASTMKLLTSIVALDRLGPGHRGFTELRSAAALEGRVLRGDLVLKGGVDPDLGVEQFWGLLLELRGQGVDEIAGDLLVDRSAFRPARMDLGVPPFDEAPEFPYNVIPDALQLADALLPLEISSAGGEVRARSVPPLPGLRLASRMTLTERRCEDWSVDWRPARVTESAGELTIELNGGFPRGGAEGCSARAPLQLIDRQRLTELLFRALWQGLGGRFTGRVREAAAPAGTRVLARRQSRPLAEVLRHVNKRSDNAHARMLFLSLGLGAMATDAATPTAELAAREVRAWLAEQRIEAPGLVLDNGSGLSRSERITPLTLARALEAAQRGQWASELTMTLPVVGSETALALQDSPAAGWARLKGGTLRDVVSLAGYVNDARGRPWAVAMMINHENARRARAALHALVDVIARDGPHPSAAPVGPGGDGP